MQRQRNFCVSTTDLLTHDFPGSGGTGAGPEPGPGPGAGPGPVLPVMVCPSLRYSSNPLQMNSITD